MAVEFMNEVKTIKRSELSPLMFDFFCMIKKIKNLQNIEDILISLPERDDILHIYIIMDKENLDVEKQVVENFSRWEMDYKQFPELHIMPRDMVASPESYLPEDAISFM